MADEPSGAFRPTAEQKEWQDAHEPFLTVRVWHDYGSNGDRTMVGIKWARAVELLDPFDKPRDLMFSTVMAIGKALEPVAAALMAVEVMATETPRKES